jgi:hypothetical protein
VKILIRDCITGSVVPVAVKRAISTASFRLSVSNSVKEIGLVLLEGLEEEADAEGEDEEDAEAGEDEAEDEDERDAEGEDEEDAEAGEDEAENPSTAGETTRAAFCRERRFSPISSTSCTFS